MQEQYFNLWVGSPPEATEKTRIDLTKFVYGRSVTLTDEDGTIRTLVFDMDNAYTMMDVLSIGMTVTFTGGTRQKPDVNFHGDIKRIEPKFNKSGDVSLTVTCYGAESKAMAVGVRDLVYPSRNHDKSWATGDLTYSDIIVNLAKDSNFKVLDENVRVQTDATATFKTPVRQKSETDWEFSQRLASKIGSTLWAETRGEDKFIFLKPDAALVAKVGDHTFFFPSKEINNQFVDFTHTSPKQIQMVDVDVTLDRDATKSGISVSTNPTTGKTEIVKEDETNSNIRWVLDEAKLRGMSSDERTNLIDLFVSGKVTWEGGGKGTVAAKNYFKQVIKTESSREAVTSDTEVVTLNDDAKVGADGVTAEGSTTTRTAKPQNYTTQVNMEKLKGMSSEKRSAIMGRIVRGEATAEDKTYYTITSTDVKEEEGVVAKPAAAAQSGAGTTGKEKKRDAGFKITALIYGNSVIKTKMSYVLEGLGKYSGKYYLYKIEYIWGNRGFLMRLIFVK